MCTDAANLWIKEGGGKFTLITSDKTIEMWSLPMAADGSVTGETRNAAKRQVRVAVPAGVGPRQFSTINLTQGCRYRFDPL
jgi:hypothetical protein